MAMSTPEMEAAVIDAIDLFSMPKLSSVCSETGFEKVPGRPFCDTTGHFYLSSVNLLVNVSI